METDHPIISFRRECPFSQVIGEGMKGLQTEAWRILELEAAFRRRAEEEEKGTMDSLKTRESNDRIWTGMQDWNVCDPESHILCTSVTLKVCSGNSGFCRDGVSHRKERKKERLIPINLITMV